jgi:hypothetical protein
MGSERVTVGTSGREDCMVVVTDELEGVVGGRHRPRLTTGAAGLAR